MSKRFGVAREHEDKDDAEIMTAKLKSGYDAGYSIVMVWINANASAMGAAVAFYTIFAIAPLFILVLALAGVMFGPQTAEHEVFEEISKLIGKTGAQSVHSILTAASQPKASLVATIIGFTMLFIGAGSVFIQLQQALNAIWNVRLKSSGISSFIRHRLLSFMMLLGIGFVLLVSLVVSAALNGIDKWVSGIVPMHVLVWKVIDLATSLGVVTLLFAMIFKMLPDVRIAWRDVWVGSLITALLFTIGKFALGAYLGRSSVSSAYGAAGSFVVVLMWVYYSAQILMFGAAFVRVYADRYGSRIHPAANAEFVTTIIKKTPSSDNNQRTGAAPAPASAGARRLRGTFTVYGLCHDEQQASRIIDQLERAGFPKDDISVQRGGAAGGIGSALVGLGILEYKAKRFETNCREGNVILFVQTDSSDETTRAREIFRWAGATDISDTSEGNAMDQAA